METGIFGLRATISKKQSLTIQIFGFVFLFSLWSIISGMAIFPNAILPTPWSVVSSFKDLHFEDALLRNLFFSLKINLLGYLEAVLVAIPLGFVIGLFPLFREAFRQYIDALRFLPLTALTGLFIAWFGIESNMKIQFLAFGILVYLLPIVIQRINEVEQIYVDTVYTLGASKLQTIKSVFLPSVLPRISDDIRVIVAISWTYIIVAEVVNKSEGGIGALAFTCARQSRIDKVFALLLVIILIGFLQDKMFGALDRVLFPFKKR